MTLQEIVRRLDRFEHGLTNYAVHPWQPSSNANVARPRDDVRVPDEAVAAGCRHFLEVFIAQELLRELRLSEGHEQSETEKCMRLIEYAEFISSQDKPYPTVKWKFPVAMMICCSECGKPFDIVITGKGPKDCPCPACGKFKVFDLDAFVKKAIGQTKKMHRVPRGGR